MITANAVPINARIEIYPKASIAKGWFKSVDLTSNTKILIDEGMNMVKNASDVISIAFKCPNLYLIKFKLIP